jgi:ribonuclease HI
MPADTPHYLLYSETSYSGNSPRWRFVLQASDSADRFAATDSEFDIDAGRLELLAVVRGLEALDRPSRVTLLTRSRYVTRGIRRGLGQWREKGWRWERFGQLVPIRDQDLWQRIDGALQFHQVECWGSRLDEQNELRPSLLGRLTNVLTSITPTPSPAFTPAA